MRMARNIVIVILTSLNNVLRFSRYQGIKRYGKEKDATHGLRSL